MCSAPIFNKLGATLTLTHIISLASRLKENQAGSAQRRLRPRLLGPHAGGHRRLLCHTCGCGGWGQMTQLGLDGATLISVSCLGF